MSSLSSLLSASSRNDKFSRLKSWSVRDHDQDHDHSYDHRPLPLSWCVYIHVRTARRAWKCLYQLHAPLFTGLTTYLRGLEPLDPISIFGSTLFVTLDVYLARLSRASPPWGETYQTLSPLPPPSCPSARLPSLFLFPYLSRRLIRVPYADVALE